MTVATSVAGVCAVRDARDLVAFTCGHYLRIGFGHVAFIDDGSSDGTFEFLSMLSRIESRVSVTRVIASSFAQRELVSNAANDLVARGFSIIVPFDVDEFWNVKAADLEARYADIPEVVFKGRWINFVQRRAAISPKPFGLFGIKYRMPVVDVDPRAILSYQKPFVSFGVTKVACKTTREIAFDLGQHELVTGVGAADADEREIFHLPFRYKCEIVKRGINYEPRRAPLRPGPEASWQSRFHLDVVLADRVDEVWAANSADRRGFLDGYGTPIGLVRDPRLQYVLLRSWWYLARHHRMVLTPS